jgi:putative DNA primase/helicase
MIATTVSIAAEHFKEWTEGSSVSEAIVSRNVRSIDDTTEIKRLLNYKPKERWQQWKHGGGWWVSGVDPETGEPTEQGGQFKPDTPIPVYENGNLKLKSDGSVSTRKYTSAHEYEAQPLFLDPGDRDYWSTVIDNVLTPICITEGAKKAGSGLTSGLATISIPGVSNGQLKGRLKDLLKLFCRVGRRVYLAFDSDLLAKPQVRAALDKLGRLISQWGAVAYIVTWSPELKGMDDYIVTHGATAFLDRVNQAQTFEEWRGDNGNFRANGKKPRDGWEAEKHFTQECLESLYGDKPWICLEDVLHFWTGTHYEPSPDPIERKRIWEFCNSYVVESYGKDGELRRACRYATPGHVNQALEWIKQSCSVDPNTVNPPGLNCTNGVLQIVWSGKVPSWRVEPHDSRRLYIYAPVATYKPNADATYCNQLLACLDEPQQQIFLKTIAAALDIDKVRAEKGRMVRALLLKGDGANGKDTLRESVAALFGYQGMTGCSFADCKQYDEGRKFPLAKLAMSRVNWATENQDTLALDRLQVLKAIITGEPLDVERKGKDDFSIEPKCVMLFNVNETPSITAALEAIQSRYGILKFSKTFKSKPDLSRGELQANPRFKYDKEFLRSEVLPALLNHILQALVDLMREGVDYEVIDGAIEEAREESCHLYQFARECGLVYNPGASVYVGDVWEKLREWYIETGTLTIETSDTGKEKAIWIDQASRFDPNVKGAHQLVARLQKLYPKVTRGKRANGSGIPLYGLGWKDEFSLPGLINSDPSVITQLPYSDPTSEAENPLPERANTFSDPKSPFFTENISNNLSEKPQIGSLEVLDQSPPALQATEVGSLKDHSVITDGSDSSAPVINHFPEIGDVVIAISGIAQWLKRGSDPLPSEMWQQIPRSQRSRLSISVAALDGDIFAELTDASIVESISADGTKVKVRNLKTDRRSVFEIKHVTVLQKGGAANADDT